MLKPVATGFIVLSGALVAASETPAAGTPPDWSLYIDIAAVSVALVGVILIVWQLVQSNDQLRETGRVARYQSIAELNRYIYENPQLLDLYVGGKRHALIANLPDAEKKRVAALDLLLDHYEFRYLIGSRHNRAHAQSLLRAQFGNPELAEWWRSELRGHFDPDFEDAVDKALAQNAKSSKG
ncbi:MAG: hypothetical protein U9P68_14970 [Pseudomonadota bacterium]|nr:hypothetical protein [Pseudomonadota bacterium]